MATPESAEISRQLLKGEEEERRRISRELHDETGQALMVLRFHLEMLAGDAKGEEQRAKVEESLEVLDRTIEGLRRIIARLSPRVLEELGLLSAIRRQAQQLSSQARIKARLELPEEMAPMDHDIEVALYRAVQEALHNIAKHSQARNFAVGFRHRAVEFPSKSKTTEWACCRAALTKEASASRECGSGRRPWGDR